MISNKRDLPISQTLSLKIVKYVLSLTMNLCAKIVSLDMWIQSKTWNNVFCPWNPASDKVRSQTIHWNLKNLQKIIYSTKRYPLDDWNYPINSHRIFSRCQNVTPINVLWMNFITFFYFRSIIGQRKTERQRKMSNVFVYPIRNESTGISPGYLVDSSHRTMGSVASLQVILKAIVIV